MAANAQLTDQNAVLRANRDQLMADNAHLTRDNGALQQDVQAATDTIVSAMCLVLYSLLCCNHIIRTDVRRLVQAALREDNRVIYDEWVRLCRMLNGMCALLCQC